MLLGQVAEHILVATTIIMYFFFVRIGYVIVVVWQMLFSLIFADVKIRHPRITTKEELKTVLLTSNLS